MSNAFRQKIINFTKSPRDIPFLAALAAGFYPFIFYFGKHFNFVNSWAHFFYFIALFVCVPIVSFFAIHKILILGGFSKFRKFVLPFLNIFTFLFLLHISVYGHLSKKITLFIIVIALVTAFIGYQQLKRIVIIQFILALLGVLSFGNTLLKHINYSDKWLQQTDHINETVFKKTPNVYYIQPDGYTNFEELKKGYYNIENSDFEAYLFENQFKNYSDFRSNYEATLASNASIFMMKHHYYSGYASANEVMNARKIIVSENDVLKNFKANGYKTHFLTEYPYLLVNRPEMGFDTCNFSYSEIPFIGNGLQTKKDILPTFEQLMKETSKQPDFFFIEIFNPKHISNKTPGDDILGRHKDEYQANLKEANKTLTAIIDVIKANDSNALIIIMADHGGYLGMERIQDGNTKSDDRNKLYSIFSAMLAIHWPHGQAPEFDTELKTSVNLFRTVFAYLSEDPSLMLNLEEDKSYGLLFEDAPKGVYELIDEFGDIQFNYFSE